MKIFEMGMLICFGASWPVSVWKSITSRTTKGKSIFFLFLIFFGYLSGLTYKILDGFDYVSWLYIFNAIMVGTDILLFFRNRKREKLEEQQTAVG